MSADDGGRSNLRMDAERRGTVLRGIEAGKGEYVAQTFRSASRRRQV
jgi:hypothetical protein